MFARRTTLSIGYIPCCGVVLMHHNVSGIKNRFNVFYALLPDVFYAFYNYLQQILKF